MSTSSAPPIAQSKPAYRLSVSLTPQQHHQLSALARKDRGSAAWRARKAVEQRLKIDRPLIQVDQT